MFFIRFTYPHYPLHLYLGLPWAKFHSIYLIIYMPKHNSGVIQADEPHFLCAKVAIFKI